MRYVAHRNADVGIHFSLTSTKFGTGRYSLYQAMIVHMENDMRTTLDLPGSLVDEALKLSNQKTKTAVIISALEDFVRKARIRDIKKYRGKVDLDIDLNMLRNRK